MANDVKSEDKNSLRIKKAFGKKRSLPSKYKPKFPDSAEREYARIAGRYMRELNLVIKDMLPEISKLSHDSRRKDARMDGISDTIERMFKSASSKAIKKVADIGIEKLIASIAGRVKKKSLSEWKGIISRTLGAEIDESHYGDDFYEDMLNEWVSGNKQLANDIIESTIERIKNFVKESVRSGKSPIEIAKGIQNIVQSSTNNAKQACKDQVSRLNTEIEKAHCEDAGSEEYMWMTKNDSKVRDSHRALHGKICRWDDPPEMWHIGPGGVTIMDGRFCHPGEDYHCRCIALPIFRNNINGSIFR